jgi:hypothetical protein
VRLCIHFICALSIAVSAAAASVSDYAEKVAPLIDPAKLATLRERGANPRVQKVTYWLAMAHFDRVNITNVVEAALTSVSVTNKAQRQLTAATMIRNVFIASSLGCLNKVDLEEMRKGNAATVRRGPYAGDQLSVDHIIPRSVVPELDNVIANLELMPQRANSKKNASIGQRQRDLARRLHAAGLLSNEGLPAGSSRRR